LKKERIPRLNTFSAEGHYERLPALAAAAVRRSVTVIAAVGGSPAAIAAKSATTSIPIVFQVGVDPVQAGLVSSMNQPGGNLTGIANLALAMGPKRLELMHELRPAMKVVAALLNPTRSDVRAEAVELQAAATTLGIELHILQASADRDFDPVFETVVRLRAGGIIISGDPYFNSRSELLASPALRHAVPAVYQFREFAAAGGLLSYGSSLREAYRLAGGYTGRILKGDRPIDLPVQQSAKAELIVNLRTAKAFGIEVPQALLARADEVLE
jgi:putative tryptophan/tyrosine transport system substrate-binding protein